MPEGGTKPRKLRVAVVIPTHWDFRIGGSQYQAKLLIEQLHELHDVDVAYFTARAGVQSHFSDHQVIAVGRSDSLRKYGHFWDYFRLQKALRKFAPDVIYQRVSCSYTGIAARYASRFSIPLIWHIASESDCRKAPAIREVFSRPHTLIETRLAKQGVRKANVIVAQTKDQARMLHQNFGRSPDRLIRNFHPVPPTVEKRNDILTVVWIANFKLLKKPELFLEIAAGLQDLSRVECLMVGKHYSSPFLQDHFDQTLKHRTNVRFLGALPQEGVNELLDRSHLLVNTSEWEGFPNTFIQAWMRSVPVLTLGVNPDGLLNSSYLGRACKSTDEVIKCIRDLVSNPIMLDMMGKQSRRYAIRHFSMRNVAELASLIVETGHDKCSSPAG
jgi:glycosyltransferase involved in cell wall biosynthesis